MGGVTIISVMRWSFGRLMVLLLLLLLLAQNCNYHSIIS